MIYNILPEITVIILLILINGLLAMSELAIVSSRKSKLQQMANNGKKHAHTVIELIEDPNQFLSTIQIGITLIGILAGAFGGATLAEPISQYLTFLGQYSTGISMIIVVIIIKTVTTPSIKKQVFIELIKALLMISPNDLFFLLLILIKAFLIEITSFFSLLK